MPYLIEYKNGSHGMFVDGDSFYFSNSFEYAIFAKKKKPSSVIKMSDVRTILSIPDDHKDIDGVTCILKQKNN